MTLFETIILSIVEGITEFLPISSTGHMMIAQNIMNMESSEFLKTFTVVIQLGSIMSVVVLYWKRFFRIFTNNKSKGDTYLSGWWLYALLILATLPAALIGFFLNDYIDSILSDTWIVAVMLFLGGILMIITDKYNNKIIEKPISIPQALIIGFYQCISMIPGTSRSMVTILGGLQQGLSRRQATEFSFFLAIPTMFGATILKLYKVLKNPVVYQDFVSNLDKLIIGNIIAFFVAMLAIKFFINFVSKYGFKGFGVYRIIISIVIGSLMFIGVLPVTL